MKKLKKLLCLVMVLVMALCLFGCGNKGKDGAQSNDAKETASYIGTWKGSDHDGEKVVHYLIFDNDGYWNVHMDYKSLVKAIKQLPEQLVSLKVFRMVQNSAQTGCFFEYVKNEDGESYKDIFTIDDNGVMIQKDNAKISYEKVSDYVGEPDETIVGEAKDLFDRARVEALGLDK